MSFVYLIFYTAYATPFFKKQDMFGGISYGVYIYAWPIQQTIAYTFPEFDPFDNVIVSTLLVIPIAFLSWRYIEKPMLNKKYKILKISAKRNILYVLNKYARIYRS